MYGISQYILYYKCYYLNFAPLPIIEQIIAINPGFISLIFKKHLSRQSCSKWNR